MTSPKQRKRQFARAARAIEARDLVRVPVIVKPVIADVETDNDFWPDAPLGLKELPTEVTEIETPKVVEEEVAVSIVETDIPAKPPRGRKPPALKEAERVQKEKDALLASGEVVSQPETDVKVPDDET